MFEQSFVGTGQESQRPWTVTISFLAQCLVLCLAALLPLIHTQALPAGQWVVSHFLAAPPIAVAPAPEAALQSRTRVAPERVDDSVFAAPSKIPPKVTLIDDRGVSAAPIGTVLVPSTVGLAGPVWGAVPGVGGGAVVPRIPPPAQPIQEPRPVTSHPVPVGGDVQAARLIHQVTPLYPPLAVQARVEGVVLLEAIIAEDGSIRRLQVLHGHPLLIESAKSAVQQWRYRPTYLNGQPVPVITQIQVRFTLRG